MRILCGIAWVSGALGALFIHPSPLAAQELSVAGGPTSPTLATYDPFAHDERGLPKFSMAPGGGDPAGPSGVEFDRAQLPSLVFGDAPRVATAPSDALSGTLSFPPDPAFYAEPAGPFDPPILPCACGCGIFEVGGVSMLPHGQGGVVWFEWDRANQDRNWHRTSGAPASDNGDKDLRTNFFQFGVQYLFNNSWGAQIEVPFADRHFRSTDDSGNLFTTDWSALGDARLKGLYTGFFEDLSLGVDFGIRLPSGDYTHQPADRDTEIGSGSTDLLLGGYYRAGLSADQSWKAFFQVEGDFPVWTRDQYRPGIELDGSLGISYNAFAIGNVNIVPVGQVLLAGRTSDRGANSAQPVASGYERILLSPAIEFAFHPFMIYGDVEFPVWQNMRGDQVVAPALFKVVVSFSF